MTRPAAIVETHVSTVVFVGERAYKLKRPVRLPFVDLTERSERERLCHREVELNRRLAPDVYLGVAEVRDPDGAVCDHLVVMRRLPEERRLSRLVAERPAEAEVAVDHLGRLVARFHAGALRSEAISAAATPERIAARWDDLDDEVTPAVGPVLAPELLAELRRLRTDRLVAQRELFLSRAAHGAVLDGHGDLQADDVFCMEDGPRVLDCVEFDDELRHVDVVDDLAFLVMDLRRLGAPALAERLVAGYDAASGSGSPRMLVEFYAAYRAMVRCMVAATRWAQCEDPEGADAVAAAALARQLAELSREQLRAARPLLVLVGGLPGTGKSTVAAGLGDTTDATVLRSDVVRKQLAGLDPASAAPAAYGHGLYSPERTDATYSELADRAAGLLRSGTSVVVDASFGSEPHRRTLREVGGDARALVLELRCQVDPAIADARIAARAGSGRDPSDATPEVAASMAQRADPWPDAVTVGTDAPLLEVRDTAREVVERERARRPG